MPCPLALAAPVSPLPGPIYLEPEGPHPVLGDSAPAMISCRPDPGNKVSKLVRKLTPSHGCLRRRCSKLGNKVNSHKRGCAVDIRGTNQGPGCQAFSGWFTALLELSMLYRGKQVVKQLPELSDCSAMNAYSTADHTLGSLPTWLLAATNRLRHTDPGSPLLARRPQVFPPRPGCAAAMGSTVLTAAGLVNRHGIPLWRWRVFFTF